MQRTNRISYFLLTIDVPVHAEQSKTVYIIYNHRLISRSSLLYVSSWRCRLTFSTVARAQCARIFLFRYCARSRDLFRAARRSFFMHRLCIRIFLNYNSFEFLLSKRVWNFYRFTHAHLTIGVFNLYSHNIECVIEISCLYSKNCFCRCLLLHLPTNLWQWSTNVISR